MAKTQKLTLIAKITNREYFEPRQSEIERKDAWIREQQRTTLTGSFKLIKVEYSLYDPEIENMHKFFEGAIIPYYAIQTREILSGNPDSHILKECREELLEGILGYDVRMANIMKRERGSITDFKEVQQWLTFVNVIKEEFFDPNGYEFPDSDKFHEMAIQYGRDEARAISIRQLQVSLNRKYANNE